MIHSTVNYLKNYAISFESSKIEVVAQGLKFTQFAALAFYDQENCGKFRTYSEADRGRFSYKPSDPLPFSKLNNPEKLIRITAVALLAIVAAVTGVLTIPASLILHQIAMFSDPRTKNLFKELDDHDWRPEFLLIKSGNYIDCMNLIDPTDVRNNERFFHKKLYGFFAFELLYLKYKNEPDNEYLHILLSKMILYSPRREILFEPFADGTHWLTALPLHEEFKSLFRKIIDSCTAEEAKKLLEVRGFRGEGNLVTALAHKRWTDLLENFMSKFEGPLPDNFYIRDAQERTVLDLCVVIGRYEFVKNTLFAENSAETWNVLFGPNTKMSAWPEELSQFFINELYDLPDDRLKAILTHQDSEGNTLLHKSPVLYILFSEGIPEVCNHLGLTPAMMHISLKTDWLLGPKAMVTDVEIPRRSFDIRAQAITLSLITLWDALAVDLINNRINRQLLYCQIGRTRRYVTTNEIKLKLQEIFRQLVVKDERGNFIPWYGAPDDDPKQFYSFLSETVVNLETIFEGLQRANQKETSAAVLIDLAVAKLNDRCARGIYEEIEQKAEIFPKEGEEITFSAAFDKKIVQWLKNVVNIVYAKYYENRIGAPNHNVHYLAKLKAFCQLTVSSDPFFEHDRSVTPELMKKDILSEATMYSLMKYLTDTLSWEMAQEYLKSLAPSILQKRSLFSLETLRSFRSSAFSRDKSLEKRYRELVLAAKGKEKDLKKMLRTALKDHKLKNVKNAILAIQNIKQVNFPLIATERIPVDTILQRRNDRLKAITGCQDLNLMLIYARVNGDFVKVEEAVIAHLTARGLWNDEMKMKVPPKSIENGLRIELGHNLIHAILERNNDELKTKTGCQDLNLIAIFADVNGDYEQVEEAVIAHLKARGHWNNQVRMRIPPKSIENSLRLDVEAAKNFQQVFLSENIKDDVKIWNELIGLQKNFREGLNAFVEDLRKQQPPRPADLGEDEEDPNELDLTWDSSRYSLPSQAWIENHRTHWAGSHIGLKVTTLLRILEVKGIIS